MVDSEVERARLETPSVRLIAAYCEAKRDGFRRGIEPVATAAEIARIEADPETWLAVRLRQHGHVTLHDGRQMERVPHSLHWLFLDRAFVGELSLRHRLNEVLAIAGGHIGYGIHPRYQGRGYGKRLLALGLDEARRIGMPRVMITASAGNIASWKIIEACGGILQDEIEDELMHQGELLRRYWIDLR